MTEKQSAGAGSWVDPDDAPELTDEHFGRAEVRDGERVVRRGRPKAVETKELVSLRLDRDVLEGWRETGPGWQTRINEALRKALRAA